MEEKPITDRLLQILACPACDSRPNVEIVDGALRCPLCARIYPIEDGVPIMLVENPEAKRSEDTYDTRS